MRVKIRFCKTSVILAGILQALLAAPGALAKDGFPERLFRGKSVPMSIEQPHALPRGDKVAPPGEAVCFPVRDDGQPYVLNVDSTINMTAALNRFYYDPKWRGEVWVPFDQFELLERQTRLMSTFKEYDEFSQLRKLNIIHKFFERASGFGP